MIKYKLGDKVEQANDYYYFEQAISMKELLETLTIGDNIITYRNHSTRIIKKSKFKGYSACDQMGKPNYDCCKICKGYLKVPHSRICPGYTKSLQSSILKIEKVKYIKLLEDSMFKI